MFYFLMFCFQSLSDPNNYHEFCRLLARLKSNYQLGELVKVENYPEVIRLIANFTVTSLQVGVCPPVSAFSGRSPAVTARLQLYMCLPKVVNVPMCHDPRQW